VVQIIDSSVLNLNFLQKFAIRDLPYAADVQNEVVSVDSQRRPSKYLVSAYLGSKRSACICVLIQRKQVVCRTVAEALAVEGTDKLQELVAAWGPLSQVDMGWYRAG
jgi:hypothetical protein